MKGAATRKILSLLVVFTLIFQQAGFAQGLGQLDISKYLNQINSFSNPNKFRPLQLRYFSYDPLTNDFQILLDKGDLKELTDKQIKEQGQELLKYFLVGIALPDENFWVNLRPDSENQIIDQELTRTDLGKVLLETDLQLKKDVASFTSPETPTGKEYWNKLYAKAGQIFNSENITIPTLTRPWIVPGEVIIRETAQSAYVYKATLKVMLEQDHLKDSADYNFNDPRLKELNEYSAQLVRQIIIPKLTKEVNSSSKYASLRQVFNSLILARWFKSRFTGKSGAYPKLINTGNLNGLASKEAWSKTTYFKEYQKSFSSGEYNIKEQVNGVLGPTIRTYFSGGVGLTRREFYIPVEIETSSSVSKLTGRNPGVESAYFKNGMAEVAGNAADGELEIAGSSSPLTVKEVITYYQKAEELQITLAELEQGHWEVRDDTGKESRPGEFPGRNITYALDLSRGKVPWKIRMFYDIKRNQTTAALIRGEQHRIGIVYAGDQLGVEESQIRKDLAREINQKLQEIKKAIDDIKIKLNDLLNGIKRHPQNFTSLNADRGILQVIMSDLRGRMGISLPEKKILLIGIQEKPTAIAENLQQVIGVLLETLDAHNIAQDGSTTGSSSDKVERSSSPMVVSSSMDLQQVDSVKATEILDSRLNPTVKTLLKLKGNVVTTAAVPSGASTGEREALELRDGQYIKDIQAGKRPNLSAEQIDRIGKMLGKQGITKEELYTLLKSRYGGKGVLIAVDNVNNVIAPAIKDFDVTQQREIDEMLIALDGTEFKEKLGANAILSVSLAVARAAARQQGLQLFEYIAQLANETPRIPLIQMFNVINGGAHAGGNLDLQEFMIVPLGFKVGAKTYRERLEIFTNVYRALERILKDRDLGIGVGDEGGFAPILSSNEGALTLIIEAIEKAGYQPGADVAFALDPAASQFFKGGKYSLKVDRREFTPAEMVKYYGDLAKRFPIFSIEDGMAEGDKEGWRLITEAAKTWSNAATSALKQTGVQIVGDDLFVTNTRIFKEGIAEGLANSILIKVNQIGTLTETLDAIKMAKEAGYTAVISHRSGETDDDFISDLLVATATGQIKTGASRGERVAKHNRIMAIEAGILAATASSPVTVPVLQKLAGKILDSLDYKGVEFMQESLMRWNREKADISSDNSRLGRFSLRIEEDFIHLERAIKEGFGREITPVIIRYLDNLRKEVLDSKFETPRDSVIAIDAQLLRLGTSLDELDRYLFALADRPLPPLGAYERPPAASSPIIVKEVITFRGQTPGELQITLNELEQGPWKVNHDSARISQPGSLPGRNITYDLDLTRGSVPWKVRMYYNNYQERAETVATLFRGEQRRIGITYEGDVLDVPESKIREDFILKINELLGQSGSAVEATQSSSPLKPGGIDFRAIPMITQPMGNLAGLNFNLPKLSNLQNINLETELNQIQGMVRAGIIPSGDRLKEYIAACYQKGELQKHLDGIVACLVDICKLEEEQVSESQAALKESLVIIDAI